MSPFSLSHRNFTTSFHLLVLGRVIILRLLDTVAPCSSLQITVRGQLSHYFQKSNNRITILTHDIEEFEGEILNHIVDWSQVVISKHQIDVQCNLLPEDKFATIQQEEQDFLLIASKVSIVKANILSEEEKSHILQYCFKKYGSTKNIRISTTIIFLTYPNTNNLVKNMQNDVEIVGNNFVF